MRCPQEWISNECGSSDQGVCPVIAGVLGVSFDLGGEYCSLGIKQPLKGRIEVDKMTGRGADLKVW